MKWQDGRKFVGEYKDGKKHGVGVLTKPDGTNSEGVWKEGVLKQKISDWKTLSTLLIDHKPDSKTSSLIEIHKEMLQKKNTSLFEKSTSPKVTSPRSPKSIIKNSQEII